MPSYQYAFGARHGSRLERAQDPELPLEVVGLEQPGCGRAHAQHDVAALPDSTFRPCQREEQRLGGMTELDAVESLDPHVVGAGQLRREPVAQRGARGVARHAFLTSRSDSSVRPSSGQSPVTMLSMIP